MVGVQNCGASRSSCVVPLLQFPKAIHKSASNPPLCDQGSLDPIAPGTVPKNLNHGLFCHPTTKQRRRHQCHFVWALIRLEPLLLRWLHQPHCPPLLLLPPQPHPPGAVTCRPPPKGHNSPNG